MIITVQWAFAAGVSAGSASLEAEFEYDDCGTEILWIEGDGDYLQYSIAKSEKKAADEKAKWYLASSAGENEWYIDISKIIPEKESASVYIALRGIDESGEEVTDILIQEINGRQNVKSLKSFVKESFYKDNRLNAPAESDIEYKFVTKSVRDYLYATIEKGESTKAFLPNSYPCGLIIEVRYPAVMNRDGTIRKFASATVKFKLSATPKTPKIDLGSWDAEKMNVKGFKAKSMEVQQDGAKSDIWTKLKDNTREEWAGFTGGRAMTVSVRSAATGKKPASAPSAVKIPAMASSPSSLG
jgi:hypothetical protein